MKMKTFTKTASMMFLSVALLVACGNDEEETISKGAPDTYDDATEGEEVDGDAVEEADDSEDENGSPSNEHDEVIHIEKELLEKGVPRTGVNDILSKERLEFNKNEDESYTYNLTAHKLENVKQETERFIEEEIVKGFADSDEFQSLHEIVVNEPYTKFTLIVDEDVFKDSRDPFAAFALSTSGLFWQVLEGKDLDSYEIQVNMKDKETDEIFESVNYLEEDINYYD